MKNPKLTSDSWWRTESFSSYDQEDNKIPTFATSLLEVLVRAVRQEKGIEGIQSNLLSPES